MNIPNLRTFKATAIAVCAAILATVAAAFAIPPGVSGGDATANGPGGFAQGLAPAAPEDLSGFVGSDRWGVSLQDVLEEVAAQNLARGGLNPVLRRMGFLGLIEAGDAIDVLLARPKTQRWRHHPVVAGRCPAGRTRPDSGDRQQHHAHQQSRRRRPSQRRHHGCPPGRCCYSFRAASRIRQPARRRRKR